MMQTSALREHSVWFMWTLMTAWAAMGFRSPKVHYVAGTLENRAIGDD